MTERQLKYARHRAAGIRPTAAARAAGYSVKGAKVAASNLERNPKVKAAIEDAREAARGGARVEYSSAEAYLSAVVAGREVPDPVRVAAARALLPFHEPRRRSPKGSASSPREQQHLAELEEERSAAEAWEATVARIEARMQKEKP